jgi:hypothetical protein
LAAVVARVVAEDHFSYGTGLREHCGDRYCNSASSTAWPLLRSLHPSPAGMADGRCQLHGTGMRPTERVSAELRVSVRFSRFLIRPLLCSQAVVFCSLRAYRQADSRKSYAFFGGASFKKSWFLTFFLTKKTHNLDKVVVLICLRLLSLTLCTHRCNLLHTTCR